MRVHVLTSAVTFCLAASLAAAIAPSAAGTVSAPAAAQSVRQRSVPVIVDCFWHPKVRPADFVLACGDGNSRLTALRWYHWGTNSARARGVNMVNDCKPYCAAGKFHSYRVLVRLDRAQPWKKRPQLQHYTRMTLVYTDGRPHGFPRMVTYPLWN